MIKLKPYAASSLTLSGLLLMAMGSYFIFLRQPLLPEDTRYMGSTLSEIKETIPNISSWLQKVFWVMGGYIFTTGLLIGYIAQTTFRTSVRGSFVVVLMAGMTSIGLMVVVNFMIVSDFRWLLLTFAVPWIVALILYCFRK